MAVREIRPGDHHGINALWESVWWPTRSQAGWRWLETNPVLKEVSAPQGWVYEGEQGEIRVSSVPWLRSSGRGIAVFTG